MAFEYFKYDTGYTNTLVERSKTSFAPLVPPYKEIYYNILIPETQPLYLYRESGGTIIVNSINVVNQYLQATEFPPTSEGNVTYGQFTGTTTALQATKLDKTVFQAYSASTSSGITRVFKPLNGTSSDTARFEAYANQQLANGQPIYLFDPNDYGFVFATLTGTTKSYNKLPWVGINGGLSAPRIKLSSGSTVISTVGIRGVELYIEPNATVTLQGFSEHTMVDLTEIRFGIAVGKNTLNLIAINATVGRIEGQTGNSNLNIKDRTNLQVQNLNEIEDVNVEGGSILTANMVRGNTLIDVGWNGTTKTTEPAIVTLAKPVSLTGKVVVYGDNNIITASHFPITIQSGATNNTIIGNNNTITDLGGINNIILQSSFVKTTTFGTYTGTTVPNTYYNKTQINSYTGATATAIGNKLNTSIYQTYTGTTVPNTYYNKTQINSYTGATNTRITNLENTSLTGTTTSATFILGNAVPITIGNNKTNILYIPSKGKIVKALAYAKTPPTGADAIFDINLNDVSIWNITPANRLKIIAGNTTGSQTSFDTVNVNAQDILTINIDQVGSTVAGQNITVQLFMLVTK